MTSLVLALAGCAGQTATIPPSPDATAVPAGALPVQPSPSGPPDIPVDIPPRAMADFSRALDAMRAGRTEDAELELKQLSAAYPQLAAPQANLGLLYRKAGRLDEAVQALQASTERRPSAPALNELGVTLRLQGRFKDAAAAYEQAILRDPAYAPAHRNLAVLLDLYLGDAERALTEMERYKELSADDKTVDAWLAELRQRAGKSPSPAPAEAPATPTQPGTAP